MHTGPHPPPAAAAAAAAVLDVLHAAVLQRYGDTHDSPEQARLQQHNRLGPQAAARSPAGHSWHALRLLQPEPGPLGMHCMAFTG
jgi:hypothetical protein